MCLDFLTSHLSYVLYRGLYFINAFIVSEVYRGCDRGSSPVLDITLLRH